MRATVACNVQGADITDRMHCMICMFMETVYSRSRLETSLRYGYSPPPPPLVYCFSSSWLRLLLTQTSGVAAASQHSSSSSRLLGVTINSGEVERR